MDRVQESFVVFTSDKQLSFCADIPSVGAGGWALTHGILRRRPDPRLVCFAMSALSKEFVRFVRFSEKLFDVDALDCRVAVFDEEGVGLPVLGLGAALCRCEVREGVYVERRVEGSCECQAKEPKEVE